MQVAPQHLARFRSALAAVDPNSFGLVDLQIYPGSTTYSARSIVLCTFDSISESLAAECAGRAAQLIARKLGIEVASGSHTDEAGRHHCWTEYFPGGAHYASAFTTVQALQAALITAASGASGDRGHARAARTAMEEFDRTPMQDIFVQSRFIISAAQRLDIPIHHVAADFAWQFGWGARSDIFYMTASMGDSMPGHQITWRKHLTKMVFEELGLPTPRWHLLGEGGDPLAIARTIGWPCVVKPTNQAFGTGVTANVRTPAELHAAVSVARQSSPYIMIEAQEPGADHRLMVVDGKLIAAARRDPPQLRGDGKRTVRDLLTELNRTRDGTRAKGYLQPVKEDPDLTSMLASQGLSMSSVPAAAATVVLRSIANHSVGGSATDVTDQVHPQIRALAEQLATSVGLRAAGIDYITPDISKSHSEVGGGFIEVNAMPRLRLLMSSGEAEEMIGSRLLGELPGRIPVTLLVADAKRLEPLAKIVRRRRSRVPGAAAVGPDWAQVGGGDLVTGSMDPFRILTAVLRNRAVEELVILWSAAEIERFGAPVDKLQRAIILDEGFDAAPLSRFSGELLTGSEAQHALDELASSDAP